MTKAGERLLAHISRDITNEHAVAAIEAEAWNAALEAVQELAEDGFGPITWLRDVLDSLRKETP